MDHDLDIDYEVPAQLPDDLDEARRRVEWHGRMARFYQAQMDDEIAGYKREIERLKGEIEARKRANQARIDWHVEPIESYHRMMFKAEPNMRTLRMPHATSKITVPKSPKVTITEGQEEQVVAWMAEHYPQLMKLPGIMELRKLVHAQVDDAGACVVLDAMTGEILEQFSAEIPEPTYKLTPEEGLPL